MGYNVVFNDRLKKIMSTEEFSNLQAEIDKLKAKQREKLVVPLLELLAPVFENNPEVESIGWNVEADYYNDEETTTQHWIYRNSILINGVDSDDEYSNKFDSIRDLVEEILYPIEDNLTTIFEEVDSQITVTREGIEIDEYSHD